MEYIYGIGIVLFALISYFILFNAYKKLNVNPAQAEQASALTGLGIDLIIESGIVKDKKMLQIIDIVKRAINYLGIIASDIDATKMEYEVFKYVQTEFEYSDIAMTDARENAIKVLIAEGIKAIESNPIK